MAPLDSEERNILENALRKAYDRGRHDAIYLNGLQGLEQSDLDYLLIRRQDAACKGLPVEEIVTVIRRHCERQ